MTRDIGKVVDDEAEILGKEVGRETRGETSDDTMEVFVSMHEVGMVAGIGHDNISRRKRRKVKTVDDRAFEGGYSPTLLSTDLHAWDVGWQVDCVMGQVGLVENGKEVLPG